jgi:adenylate cyclase
MAPVSPKRALPWAAAVTAVAVLAAIWFTVLKPGNAPTAPATIPSIAVLPFDNMGGDPALTYLGDGVAEDIITMLSRFPDLSVVARNSSFTYKGRATDIRQVGKELDVRYVLEGSVRKEGGELRITAQLIDANDGKHVWAERFDKAGKDPMALQDEVTGKIVGTLTGEQGQIKRAQYAQAWGKDTANLEEYDYYLRGHDLLMKAESRDENDRAGRIWEEGLAKFSNSDLLKVKLGFYHWSAAWNFWSDDLPGEFRKTGKLVREVLAKDNLTPQVERLAHWLFAFVLMQERDFAHSVDEAEAAVAMGPYDGFVMANLTDVLIASGQYDKALDWLAKAEARDPSRKMFYGRQRAYIHRLAGQYEQSIEEYKLAEATTTTWPYPHLSMAIDYVRLGRLDEAKAAVKDAQKLDSSFTQAKWREGSVYSDPKILDNEVADLAKAGLPEK